MKKFIAIAISLILTLSLFTACAKKEENENEFKVGICNFVDDASLNQIIANIEARLKEIETEANVKFNVKVDNCNTDANLMNQIISGFIADEVDLMVAVATPVAMAMQAATEENNIPVIFAAVSDPVGAGIVESLEVPGSNITGTSDYLNTTAVMNLMFAQNPDLKNVALLYDLSQDSSKGAIQEAEAFLKEKNVSYKAYTGTNTNEVLLAAQSIVVDKADAVFTPTDNTIMKAELAIYETLANAKIPHFAGADSFALNGAFVGYGVDYANLGRETAGMVKKVLVDKVDISKLSVMTFDNGRGTVNTDICEKLGVDYETVKNAFTPYCTTVEPITTAEEFEN